MTLTKVKGSTDWPPHRRGKERARRSGIRLFVFLLVYSLTGLQDLSPSALLHGKRDLGWVRGGNDAYDGKVVNECETPALGGAVNNRMRGEL
jgi:hypothetical protein